VITLILLKEKGVRNCIVDYVTDLASIEYTPRYISEEKILSVIKKLGYLPSSLQDPRQKAVSRSLYLRFIVAAFFSLNIMMFSYPIYASYFDKDLMGYSGLFGWLSFLACLPILTYSAWPIWQRFYHSLKVGIWGMEALVLIGVTAAVGLSIYELLYDSLYIYFDSMSVIIVFVLLGKIIESKAKFSAKDALIQLTRALPRRGRKRMADQSWEFVPLKNIQVNDCLIILSGEKVVLDGVVVEGSGACDESLMTGEYLPVRKEKHSFVLAGTILQQGHLVIQVTAELKDTALQRIIGMIEQDISHKVKYVRSADQIVKWFVPLVLAVSLVTAFFVLINGGSLPEAIIRVVSILLISCPCAIGIAAPLAEAYILNAMAKLGVIIRNRGCLAYLGKETVIICDKTGTMTEGKFTVLKGLEELDDSDKSLLRSLVDKSTHPIAVSLQNFLQAKITPLDSIEEIAGRGIRGKYGLQELWLGSANFLKQQGFEIPAEEHNFSGVHTLVYFKTPTKIVSIALGDRLRENIKELIASFKPAKTLLVSGDNSACVEYVAHTCGFDAWFAGYHPLQKRELIDGLRSKGEIVAMIGDGINDAPSLTAANIGIAVVSATDISIQVSDILLTTNQLSTLTALRKIALLGQKIIKQNLFWAFFYNLIGIGLAMVGYLNPLFAAFAMIISSLIVLFNAHRIKLNEKDY